MSRPVILGTPASCCKLQALRSRCDLAGPIGVATESLAATGALFVRETGI